jgi:cell wall-associated NlpC family hydrolase
MKSGGIMSDSVDTSATRAADGTTAQVRTAQVRTAQVRTALARTAVLVSTALVIGAAAVLGVAGPAAAGPGHPPSARRIPAVNTQIAAYAETFVGRYRYHWGGISPRTGFDCSGLTSYIYQRYGLAIPRTAQEQFTALRRVSRAAALPGDLVFFHASTGYVYHVGIYEGGGHLVAAADPRDGIIFETIWTSAVTFGTLTH